VRSRREGKLILHGVQVPDQVSTLGLHGKEKITEAFLDGINLRPWVTRTARVEIMLVRLAKMLLSFQNARTEEGNTFKLSRLGMLKVKSKAIPVTGWGGIQGCEMLRIPHVYTIGSQMAAKHACNSISELR
jgi:hypothetical protein